MIFIPLISLPFVLFNKQEKHYLFICCLIPILFRYLYEYNLHYNFIVLRESIQPFAQYCIYLFAIFTAFIFTFYFVFVYFLTSNRYAKKILQNNTELNDANQFLNQKNKELVDAYKQLEDKKKLDIEFEIAQEQQEEFLPSEMPRIPEYTIEHYFKGARGVSGDFFDYRCFGRVAKFFVADVMSKSMSAAFVTVHLYSLFRTVITAATTPSSLLNTMNRAFSEGRGSHEKASAFAFDLDTRNHTITYAHACIGIAISILDGKVEELEVSGMMAGASADIDYKMNSFQLEPGDMLIVASDGLEDFKMADGKRFGHKRIMAEIKDYARRRNELDVSFRDYMVKRFETLCDLDALQADDVVLIVVQRD